MDENSVLLPGELRAQPPEQKRTFTARDWEDQKDNIARFYVEENKTLKEVISLIENQYGLRATERMYKRRIEKWHLDKNNKFKEMTAIVRIQRQRENDGKRTRFRVRGRAVDLAEVDRYMRRRKLRQQSSPVLPASDIGTPSELSYSSVSPRPRSASVSTIGDRMDPLGQLSVFSDDCQQNVQPLASVPSEMTQPENSQMMPVLDSSQLRVSPFDPIDVNYLQESATSTTLSPSLCALDPSRFLIGLDYFVNAIVHDDTNQSCISIPNSNLCGSPGTHALVRDHSVYKLLHASLRLDQPRTLWGLCGTASALWANNKPREARILLDQASEMLKDLLLKRRLETLIAILRSVATFENVHHPELTDKFLELASGMSAIVLGATHPITMACQCLLASPARIAICRMSLHKFSEICSSTRGGNDRTTLDIHYCFAHLLLELGEYDLAETASQNLVKAYEHKWGGDSYDMIRCLYLLTDIYCSQGKFSVACSMVDDLMVSEKRLKRNDPGTWHKLALQGLKTRLLIRSNQSSLLARSDQTLFDGSPYSLFPFLLSHILSPFFGVLND